MPPRLLAACLALLAACSSSGRRTPFDPGQRVHFVVRAQPPGAEPFTVAPVCTAGTYAVRARPVTIPPGGEAVEVAFLDVASAHYRVSMYDAGTGAVGRGDAAVGHEAWVVLEVDPASRRGRLGVFLEPPHEEIGGFRPLPVASR